MKEGFLAESFREISQEDLIYELERLRSENNFLKQQLQSKNKAEQSLLKLTAKLKAVFENDTQLYVLIDDNYKIKAYNETANRRAKLYFNREFQKGESVFNFVRREDLDEFRQNIIKAFSGKYCTSIGSGFTFNDKLYWYEFHYAPVISDDGSVKEVFINAQDITRRKRVEEELRISENKIRAILETLPDVVVRFYTNGEIIDFLSPAEKDFLIHKAKKPSNNIFDLFPLEISKSLRHYVDNAKIVGNVQRFEYKYTKNKKVKFEEARLIPIDEEQLLIIFRDVTKRKSAESNLKRYINELHISQQELKKQKEKLAASEEELKKININKDKFFSIIAHDLKNPFNILLGYTSLVKDEFDELTKDDLKTFTERIDTASKHLFDLVESLLEWSRIQRDKVDYNPTNFSIFEVVEDHFYVFKMLAEEKSITLLNEVPKETSVFADENMISTVLRNLISNSIKFTNLNGEIKVYSKTEGNKVTVTVEDNGVGMPEEIQNKLFKIEEHVTTYGTNKEKGTGLGLLLCKEFIEKNGGRIWVESREGEGSKFRFSLPIKG